MNDEKNIIIVDDQDNNDVIYDISDRIYELRDDLSVDILSRNIIDSFNEPKMNETINYVTEFIKKYDALNEMSQYDGDFEILNANLQEISELVLSNLKVKFNVGIGTDIDEDMTFDIRDYMERLECLYNFFVVRRYTNIKDYFKSKLLQNKLQFIEKYKSALDDKAYDDLFLAQDKKKYHDVSDAIIIHFFNDIIMDIKSTITSGYSLFKEIVNLDLYEEYNNRMDEMLNNYGTDFNIEDDEAAAADYLNILDNDELFVSLRNDLLSNFLLDIKLSDK